MFYECNKLVSLDISNFNSDYTTNMVDMLYNCNNLEFINFGDFVENENINISNIFYGITDYIVFCSNNEKICLK